MLDFAPDTNRYSHGQYCTGRKNALCIQLNFVDSGVWFEPPLGSTGAKVEVSEKLGKVEVATFTTIALGSIHRGLTSVLF